LGGKNTTKATGSMRGEERNSKRVFYTSRFLERKRRGAVRRKKEGCSNDLRKIKYHPAISGKRQWRNDRSEKAEGPKRDNSKF